MEPITIKCDKCGASAVVHVVRYTYNDGAKSTSNMAECQLLAVERDVECPNCGRHMQVESAG